MIQIIHKDIHGNVTKAMQNFVNKKFVFLEKEIPEDRIKILVSREGDMFKASLQCKLFKLNSNAEEDAYMAIASLVDKAKSMMRENRSKSNHRKKRGSILSIVTEGEESVEYSAPKIIKRKRFNAKPMTEDVAIGEMEALGHDAFIFMNSEIEGRICMIYTRKDEGYGIIELY